MTRSSPPPISRRAFLEAATLSSAAVACSSESAGALTGPSPDTENVKDTAGSDSNTPDSAIGDGDAATDAPDTTDAGKTIVACVAVSDSGVDLAVRRAIELAGGIDAIQAGQTVFIKPNAVHPFSVGEPGIVTSGAVLAAVVRLVKERGAKVIVGDRSARGFASAVTLNDTGLADAAEKAGADEIYGAPLPKDEPDAWVLTQPPGWEETWQPLGGILAMRKIVEADHFINVAVCKNHRWAGFSLTLKNLIGAIGDDSRDRMHYVSRDAVGLSNDIVTLNGAFSPLMNLIDATTCIVNGGPEGILGDEVTTKPGLIFASRDRVALDALGVSLIQEEQSRVVVEKPDEMQTLLKSTSAWKLPQIAGAVEVGLGAVGPEAVSLRFEGLADAVRTGLEARFTS